MSATPAEVKACCAAAYAGSMARFLLGESFHPGGARLTSRLVRALRVGPGALVVDVASGPGASALQLARETGCDVVGVDLASASVAVATAAAEAARLASRVRFVCGDAESLPLPDASADGALCECSFCLFPDKEAAAGELARVLKPGGRLALADVIAVPERLPAELRTLAAWAACLADARPLEDTAALLESAGLAIEEADRHDHALAELLDRVEARLRVARFVAGLLPGELTGVGEQGLGIVASARAALAGGALGYGVIVARR